MYDTGIMFLLGRVADTLEGQDDPHARVVMGLQAFLSVLSAEPAFCSAIIIEVHAAGPEALARRRAVLRVFADRYLEINAQARERRQGIAPLPDRGRPLAWWAASSTSSPFAWRRAGPRSSPSSPTSSPRSPCTT